MNPVWRNATAGMALGLALVVRTTVPAGAHPAPSRSPAAGGPPAFYVVARGDTLSEIAAANGVTVAELAAVNGITDPNRIRAGTQLVLPSGWRCPVPGVARFVDDFDVVKLDGRRHEGVDLHAPRGSPVVAPVAGEVRYVEGRRGGLQFDLAGDDGDRYVGSHLDSAGVSGRVRPGDSLGTVGDSGNARGSDPHLHFEIHPGHGPAANPYDVLVEACPL